MKGLSLAGLRAERAAGVVVDTTDRTNVLSATALLARQVFRWARAVHTTFR